jgi:hypothetical protein
MYANRGFIALMSAVIISVVLLLTVVTGALSGIFARSNVLDAELKSRSRAVADACLDQALLLITNDPGYGASAPETEYQKFNSLDACELTVSGAVPTKIIGIQGSSTKAVTNLSATYDTDAKALSSLTEVP